MLKIRQALQGKLSAYAKAKPIPLVFENVKSVSQSGDYLEAYTLPARAVNATFCGIKESGIFQVTIYTRLEKGWGVADGLAAEIVALYPSGSMSGHVMHLEPPSRTAGFELDGWYAVVVSIPYVVY